MKERRQGGNDWARLDSNPPRFLGGKHAIPAEAAQNPAHFPTNPTQSDGLDPDLAAIMAAWPKLGPATRASVLRIVGDATRE
ncbi:MAG: hypothetical protein IPM64_07240 [Phycisphaerales bacterium]|nr:hypothetical protein [Phycisphaerales bacterium]